MRKGSYRLAAGFCACALLVLLAGCGGGTKSPKAAGSGSATSATGSTAAPGDGTLMSEPITHKMQVAHADLLALSRTSASNVTVRIRIFNDGTGPMTIWGSFGEEWMPGIGLQSIGLNAGGVALLDALHNKVYYPSRTTDGNCLCTDLSNHTLQKGETISLYAVFPAPPADVTRVTVLLPLTAPFQDVPIGNGPVPLPDPSLDPTKTPLGPARVYTLQVGSDGGVASADEDDSKRAVKLSSDVLFAINKADLTSAATAVLQDLAKQIDASTGATVKVDGYTDNTGNDAINQPLSQHRAAAVAGALRQLVTRQGVSFQTAGHGSADPVADNGNPDGRRKNRRVTVTFALPIPKPAPATTAASGSGAPFQRTTAEPQVIASGQFTNSQAKDLKVEVNGLHRDASGLTSLVWTVRNTGSGHVDTGTALELNFQLQGAMAPHRGATDGGVMLVDRTSSKARFHTLQADIGHCMCTTLVGDAKTDMGPNESTTYYNVFKLSPETQTVDIQIPWSDKELLTISNVPVK